jgi:HSP20 family protein
MNFVMKEVIIMVSVPQKSKQNRTSKGVSETEDSSRQLANFQRRIWNMFPSILFSNEEDIMAQAWAPAVDIRDHKDKILVRAELPGVKKEDLDVHIDENVLYIRGEKKEDTESKEGEYVRTERFYGSFSRGFTLPTEVDAQNIKASFKEGILELEIPKREQASPKQQRINIQ